MEAWLRDKGYPDDKVHAPRHCRPAALTPGCCAQVISPFRHNMVDGQALLGLTDAAMARHIAWDIGIAGLGARLSALLGATFIRQTYSRLVIDCNRQPGGESSIVIESDGVVVPGNRALTPADIQARIDEIYTPYQAAIGAELDRRGSGRTLLVSLHSFTPSMGGVDRPWHYGVLHRGDSAFSDRVLRHLRAVLGEAVVGDNQPYALDSKRDKTVPLHVDARAIDYLEIEVRQDLLGDEPGQAAVAQFLAPVLTGALSGSAGSAEPAVI